jgi:hypothetical protein
VSNVVPLRANSRRDDAQASTDTGDLKPLRRLQTLCEEAIASGGLESGGPSALDLIAAAYMALKPTGWILRGELRD